MKALYIFMLLFILLFICTILSYRNEQIYQLVLGSLGVLLMSIGMIYDLLDQRLLELKGEKQ